MQQAAIAQFLFDEAEIIMLGGAADGVVIHVVRLHQDATGQVPTTGATRDLGEQLKDAFGGTEVRQAECVIDAKHADQRDTVNVVALGNHLRADQQIHFAAVQAPENAFVIAMMAHGVAIHAGNAGVREQLLQPLLTLLRADAEKIQMLAFALRAMLGNGATKAAVMAFHALMHGRAGFVLRSRLVMGEGDGTVVALQFFAAGSAHHDERIAAPIQQQHGLLTATQRRFNFLCHGARE